ncbi:tRNA dihydrouridine synthase [Pseudogymnoascus australis]
MAGKYVGGPDVKDGLPPSDHVNPLKLFDIAREQGRPLYTSAPMVRYSKLAFRQTVHKYGVDLCWTPMILAKEFNRSVFARDSDFTLAANPTLVPTIVQFGANSPLEFARATSTMAPFVSGVDLNCGCPQSWACAECLGAALMNKRELVADIVKEAKATLKRDGYEGRRTVSVKIRIHKDLRQTMDFIKTVQDAGVDFLTIHGRTKAQRSSEPVNTAALSILRSHVTVPLIANGDVSTLAIASLIAAETGVDGVMSARDLLANPGLFKGYDTCPWKVVEEFINRVVRAPIPFKLVVHHLSQMTGSGGGGKPALLGKEERGELMECRDLIEVIDFLDRIKGITRLSIEHIDDKI